MERLTKRDKNGKAIPAKTSTSFYVGAIYEEEKVLEAERLELLCEYEDKLESGQLVELPCKVGDTVFVLRSGAGSPLRIEEDRIIGFDILQNTIMAHGKYGHAYSEVFLTKLEAEARLKELKEKL